MPVGFYCCCHGISLNGMCDTCEVEQRAWDEIVAQCEFCPGRTMVCIQPSREGIPKVWVCPECGHSSGGREEILEQLVNRLRTEIVGLWYQQKDIAEVLHLADLEYEEWLAWRPRPSRE